MRVDPEEPVEVVPDVEARALARPLSALVPDEVDERAGLEFPADDEVRVEVAEVEVPPARGFVVRDWFPPVLVGVGPRVGDPLELAEVTDRDEAGLRTMIGLPRSIGCGAVISLSRCRGDISAASTQRACPPGE